MMIGFFIYLASQTSSLVFQVILKALSISWQDEPHLTNYHEAQKNADGVRVEFGLVCGGLQVSSEKTLLTLSTAYWQCRVWLPCHPGLFHK